MSGWDEKQVLDEFDEATFNSGIQKRVSIVLLLDTSQSMLADKDGTRIEDEAAAGKKRRIEELNDALAAWAQELRTSPRLIHRAELAIITFGNGGVNTLNLGGAEPFTPAAKFTPPRLQAGGLTPMVAAVRQAIQLGERRKAQLDEASVLRFRTLIFMITDGEPTDDEGKVLNDAALRPLADELLDLERRKKLAFFAAGVMGARLDVLKALSPEGFWDLSKGSFTDFLKLVSASAGDADPIAYARQQLAKLSAGSP